MKYKKGFVLIEAILAVSLVSSSVLLRAQYEKRENEIAQYRLVGKEISNIVAAIDKRVLLDGIEGRTTWDGQWNDTNKVLENFTKELIAKDNPECGEPDGWEPNLNENRDVALVSCNMDRGLFRGFNLESKREGENKLLQEWKFTLYADDQDFNKMFDQYERVINSAKLNDAVRVTGAHNYKLIDRGTGKEISIGRCFNLREQCGIEASFTLNKIGIAEDYHLRVNGENSMRNSLTFASNAKPAVCYRYDSSNKKIESTCGLEYDIATEALSLNAKDASVGSVYITAENKDDTLSPVFCQDTDDSGNQSQTLCGMTAINSGGSVLAEAYVNAVKADQFIRLAKSGGSGVAFEVDKDGDLYTARNAEVGQDLTVAGKTVAKGDFTAEKNATVKGRLTVNNDAVLNKLLTVAGNAQFKSAVDIDGNTNIDRTLVVGQDSTFKSNVVVDKSARIKNSLTVDQNHYTKGWITSERDITAKNNLIAERTLYAKQGADIRGNALVSGAMTINGNAVVGGDTTLNGGLTAKQGRFLDKVFMDNSAAVKGNLDVTQDVKSRDLLATRNVSANGELKAGTVLRTPRAESGLTYTDKLYMRQFASAGQSCYSGQIAMTTSGTILSCVSGRLKATVEGATSGTAGIVTLSDSVTSTSSSVAASSRAAKTAYDKGVEALNLAKKNEANAGGGSFAIYNAGTGGTPSEIDFSRASKKDDIKQMMFKVKIGADPGYYLSTMHVYLPDWKIGETYSIGDGNDKNRWGYINITRASKYKFTITYSRDHRSPTIYNVRAFT
ncbi:tail fiber protein [Vibrio sp. D431a]|uniref:tail fiber protein n=1 Tax=Vibrio sp. D431a TaxID=2837388 RepID=UPI00255627C2|nr:tail fiber protein [Vibrio sp. D431a]MDK9793343.1 tail fiber protein [Vibrio sp. D431a]